MTKRITVQERVAELVAKHGSYRAAAEVVMIDFAALHKLGTGKAGAGPKALRQLGLDRSGATYPRLTCGNTSATNRPPR
jgi:hypothetical protein